MVKTNGSLLTAFLLAVAFCAAFAVTHKTLSARFLQPKTTFIPDACVIGGALPICPEELALNQALAPGALATDNFVLPGASASYPACVCFSNGTCEFRSDKSRCQWCYNEGAASVNEGERCPDLQGGSLYVCPQKNNYPIPIAHPIVDPLPPVPIADPIVVSIDPIAVPIAESSDPIAESSDPIGESSDPISVSSDPIAAAPASKQKISSKRQLVASAPILTDTTPISVYPISTPIAVDPISKPIIIDPLPLPVLKSGCICTEDGTCKKSKVTNWKKSCRDDQVIAVVEDGPCPKSSPCQLQSPGNAYKCTNSDRVKPGKPKICPMFMTSNGCICYKDGTCQSQGTNSCMACQDDTVVSVTQGSDCICE